MLNRMFKMFFFASILFFFVAGVIACDTFGSADYQEMMAAISKGKQGEAYSILKTQHCEDTLAWRMANNLMSGKENPVDVFKWIVQDGCKTKWVYAGIPIYYVRYNKDKYEGVKIINSFADEYRKNDCSHDEQMAIEIEVDGVGTYFYWDLNNYKKNIRLILGML